MQLSQTCKDTRGDKGPRSQPALTLAPARFTTAQGKQAEALDTLLNLEKQYRLAENVFATSACCLAVLDVLYEAKEWKLLNEHIILLAKRRSQLKQARTTPMRALLHRGALTTVPGLAQEFSYILPVRYACSERVARLQAVQAFVKQAVSYVDHAPDRDTTVELIKTLQSVTEGKVSRRQAAQHSCYFLQGHNVSMASAELKAVDHQLVRQCSGKITEPLARSCPLSPDCCLYRFLWRLSAPG